MPLVDITLKNGYRAKSLTSDRFRTARLSKEMTLRIVRVDFGSALPRILIDNAAELGLDPTTPPEGVQVMHHDYGPFDLNTATVWVKLQYSEDCPTPEERLRIRDRLYSLFMEWFAQHNVVPEDFVIDIFWGPTNGRGVVGGVEIVW